MKKIRTTKKKAEKEQPRTHTLAPSIPWSPHGIVLALQYWTGDEKRSLELARDIADLEPVRRNDVALYFCCDEETVQSEALLATQRYCEGKMYVGAFQSSEAGHGYPAGPNVLWANSMKYFYRQWCGGVLRFESVFTFESDGGPIRRDWISKLIEAQRKTIEAGLLITGARLSNHFQPHVNGNMIAHVSLIRNYPELLETPPNVAWDIHHRTTLTRLARHDNIIRSEHRSTRWSKESLTSMSSETAWLHGCIDNSLIGFSRGLVGGGK